MTRGSRLLRSCDITVSTRGLWGCHGRGGRTTLIMACVTFANIISLASTQSEGLNLTAKEAGGCSLPVCTGRRNGIGATSQSLLHLLKGEHPKGEHVSTPVCQRPVWEGAPRKQAPCDVWRRSCARGSAACPGHLRVSSPNAYTLLSWFLIP